MLYVVKLPFHNEDEILNPAYSKKKKKIKNKKLLPSLERMENEALRWGLLEEANSKENCIVGGIPYLKLFNLSSLLGIEW